VKTAIICDSIGTRPDREATNHREGVLINAIVLIFELLSYVLFAACAWHAWQHNRFGLAELIFAVFYGVALEWVTLRQLEAYAYGEFWLMFDGAPLTIGVGWAIIMYSAMAFSDRLAMPESARPFLDVLLALNIDLAMDTIAVRLGMWHWGALPLDQQWFGVPWVNFWAWFIVVLGFSTLIRILRVWRVHRLRRWFYIPTASILALILLALTNEVYTSILEPGNMALGGILLLVGSALYVVIQVRPHVLQPGPPEPAVIAVPLVFHVVYISAGIHYGFYSQTPALALVGLGMLGIGLGIHLWPWWATR
jgi:hypothetical protein